MTALFFFMIYNFQSGSVRGQPGGVKTESEKERERERKREGEKATRATDTQHYFTKPIIHRAIAQTDIVHFKKKYTHSHTHTHTPLAHKHPHKYACLCVHRRTHIHGHNPISQSDLF